MFFAALDRLRQGSLVCVFDATDRIQHMFWHYLEEDHPANNGKDTSHAEHRKAIEDIYKHNDALVGKVMADLRDGDVLIVLSDHGFNSFQRGVNLNGWLLEEGLLHLKEGTDGSGEWLKDVDWSRTKAYSLGLTGMFLNLEGREAMGIVKPGADAKAVKKEIIRRMTGLEDEGRKVVGIQDVFDTDDIYDGPYKENAPDLIIGYANGYRILLGLCHRNGLRSGLRRQRESVERRPLRRPAARPRRSLLQLQDRIEGSVAPRHRSERSHHVRRRAAEAHGGTAAVRARELPEELMRRFHFRALALALALVAVLGYVLGGLACGRGHASGNAAPGKRVLILGFDGMDYALTKKMMDEGKLPNFSRLAKSGGFGPLQTAIPPQSPVAWSNFITGMDSGGHGIYDFIHRDPKTMLPYLSTSKAEGGRTLKIGKYQFPLTLGEGGASPERACRSGRSSRITASAPR